MQNVLTLNQDLNVSVNLVLRNTIMEEHAKVTLFFVFDVFVFNVFAFNISVTDFVGFFSSSHSVHSSNVLKSFCCVLDLNECSNKFICAKHAKCTNLPGSYKCECNPGYSGDGKYCNGTMFV
jgi:hypothetical protein